MANEGSVTADPAWNQYGRALIQTMAEVTAELPQEFHAIVLETADYWLSLGLVIGTQQREQALALLDLIESEGEGRTELATDAKAFCEEALG